MARFSTAVGSVIHPSAFRSPGLFTKAIISLAICLTAGLLVAQAPPDDTPVREETDEKGFKVQVPSESLTKGPKARSTEQALRSTVRKILNGDSLNADAGTRRNFRNYFRQYLFPLMTTEEGLKDVANHRILFLRDLQTHRNPEAHTELIRLTLLAMRQIVEDPAYRLAARYNAMLIIGSLNDQEPNANVNPQLLPEPMQLALPVIYQQFKKADNHDSIRIAALIGLSRHLEWDNYKGQNSPRIPPAARVEIIKELTSLAEAKQPPEGRDADVHNWMRRRAIEGLALACLTTPDAGIAATMEKLVKDDTDAMNIRTTAANMFGRMSLQPPVKVDPVALAKDLGYVALVACDAELTKAEANRKTEAEREARLMGTYSGEIDYSGGTGGPGGMMRPGGLSGEGMSGMGGPRAPVRPQPGLGSDSGIGSEYGIGSAGIDPSLMDPKQYRVEYLRRKLRQHLFAVQQGLVGNDDHAPPKTTGNAGKNPSPPTTKTGSTDANAPPAEKKGLFNVAKTKPEQEGVDAVYFKVRRLAEIVEVAGAEADFYQLVKDLRKELQTLEAITKRLPPAGGAAPAAATAIDAPTMPAGPGKAGAPKGKPAPVKAAPPPAGKGKAAARPLPRQSAVFGKPRAGR